MINIPEFVKEPLPLVCLHGSVVSFSCCTEPIDAEVIWTVCGREITDKSRNYSVSFFYLVKNLNWNFHTSLCCKRMRIEIRKFFVLKPDCVTVYGLAYLLL